MWSWYVLFLFSTEEGVGVPFYADEAMQARTDDLGCALLELWQLLVA